MRIVGFALASAALVAGCAASRQEVAARLGAEYVVQNVDAANRLGMRRQQ